MVRRQVKRQTVELLAGLFLLLSSCGFGKSGGLSQSGAGGLAVFEFRVLPELQARCGTCHGAAQSPLFAVSDPQEAYNNGRGELNVASPEDSDFINKASDNHNGCSARGTCQADTDALLPLIIEWAEAEKVAASGPTAGVNLAAQPIPTGLPDAASGNFSTMTWPLDSLGPQFSGATFTMDIRIADTTVDYEVANPTFNVSSNIYVRSVNVVYNGTLEGASTTWTSVDTTISPPSEIVSPERHLFLVQLGQGIDTMAINFAEITAGVAPCSNLAGFVSDVLPIFNASCVGCHGGGNPGATAAFSIQGDNSTICSNARERSDLLAPTSSLIITKPTNQVPHGGNQIFTVGSAQYNAIRDWVTSE